MKLNSSLETKAQNLFAVGDGAGVTRGLMQASISGIIAAKEITRKEGASRNQLQIHMVSDDGRN